MDKLLVAALMAALGISKAAAEAMIADEKATNGEALAEFNRLHPIKINTLKEEARTAGYDKAKGEVLTQFEDELKEEYGIKKTKKKGLDLIKEVVEAKTPNLENPEAITADVVKKHPVFIAREKELTEQLEAAQAETEGKVNEVKADFEKKETHKTIFADAFASATKMKAAFSTKPEVLARQQAVFQKMLLDRGYDFEIRGTGANKTILLKYAADTGEFKKGARVEDAHGNPVTFDSVVKEAVLDTGLDFLVANPKESLGGGGKGPNIRKAPDNNNEPEEVPKYSGAMPTNDDEYIKIVTDKTIPVEQRNEVEAFYNKPAEA
jgi:hypothetical protein